MAGGRSFNPGWTVRAGRIVRVDLTEAARLSRTDAHVIVAATDEFLDDEAGTVEVIGPVDAVSRPIGLSRAIKALQRLAEQRDKDLIVSPI
jgi:hypothetical protein